MDVPVHWLELESKSTMLSVCLWPRQRTRFPETSASWIALCSVRLAFADRSMPFSLLSVTVKLRQHVDSLVQLVVVSVSMMLR